MQFKEHTCKSQRLEISTYSSFLNANPITKNDYYNFFCDYHGKKLFFQYIETSGNNHPISILQESLPKIFSYSDLNKVQKVLWAYYFFDLIGLTPRVNVGVSSLIKFLHLTNNISISKIKNSYYSTLALKAPNIKVRERLISDLIIVRENFIGNGLPSKAIDMEISKRK